MTEKWFKETPAKEGWYFWRTSSRRTDPWSWHAVFVLVNDDKHEFWEAGSEIGVVKTGQWYGPLATPQ